MQSIFCVTIGICSQFRCSLNAPPSGQKFEAFGNGGRDAAKLPDGSLLDCVICYPGAQNHWGGGRLVLEDIGSAAVSISLVLRQFAPPTVHAGIANKALNHGDLPLEA